MNDRLYGHYNSELEALRGLGGQFARAHPKIAGRLRLSPDAVDDPQKRLEAQIRVIIRRGVPVFLFTNGENRSLYFKSASDL